MAKPELLSAALSAAVLLVTPAMARESHLAARRKPMRVSRLARAILARVMVFAAIALASASVAAATVTAPAVCMDPAGTGTAMCGVTGVPTMDPWFL